MRLIETDQLEVRVLDDGVIQGRRKDRRRMTAEDRLAAQNLAQSGQQEIKKDEPPANPTDGKIIAVKICSRVLDACIWFSFDPDFKPDDDEQLAVFYAD